MQKFKQRYNTHEKLIEKNDESADISCITIFENLKKMFLNSKNTMILLQQLN